MRHSSAAFNRLELVVVLGLTFVLFCIAFLLLSRSHVDTPYVDKQVTQRITCENNLKQLGCAYRIWENDNGNRYPFDTTVVNGGWNDLLSRRNAGAYCWTNYALMANELGSARVLACPLDIRKPAADFAAFTNNTVLSYFVGVQANDNNPKSILGGDRNLGPGEAPDSTYGFSPENGNGNDVVITGAVSWSLKMHSKGNPAGAGYVLLGDGRVQSASSGEFRTNLLQAALARDATNPVGLRVIFP
jgi:hypothetical protein